MLTEQEAHDLKLGMEALIDDFTESPESDSSGSSVSDQSSNSSSSASSHSGSSDSSLSSVSSISVTGFQWPGPNGDAEISLGETVVVDSETAEVRDLTVHGTLRFAPGVNTTLTCRTLHGHHGVLEIGTAANPITASARVVIRDVPIDAADTEQIGNGVHWMGAVVMHGAPKTPYARLAGSATAGQTVLTLATSPSGWNVGDELAVADSRFLNDPTAANAWKRDRVTITAINGSQVTVSPLAIDHPQATDAQGNPLAGLTAHVANLTRNVIVESQNANGVRGHFMVMDHIASANIRYVTFKDLGRTTFADIPPTNPENIIGRYPLHIHLLGDAGAGVHCEANVIDGGNFDHDKKWGITLHGTNFATLRENVVFNMSGAGIAIEDGTEHDNLIDGNLVIHVLGNGASRADSGFPGREGDGFWNNATTANRFLNNVAVGCRLHGFTFFGGGPFLEFAGNEVYGGRNGLTVWYINGADTGQSNPSAPQSFIDDLLVWNCWNHAVGIGYPAYNLTWRNLRIIRGDIGWYFGDYRTRGLRIEHCDISQCLIGIEAPMVDAASEFVIDHPLLANYTCDVRVSPQQVVGGGGWTPGPRTVRIISPTWNPAKLCVSDTDPNNQVIVE